MAGFFSVKVAKGVRLSASSRGLRAHVGPRGARLHVGGGGTGVSTGSGPFTYYSSLSGSRARSTSRGSGGPTKAQLAQMEKEQEFLRLREIITGIVEIHQVEFPPAEKPQLPPPPPPDPKPFQKAREKEEMAGISLFKRTARKEAKKRASELAAADLAREKERLAEERRREQTDLDAAWDRLLNNDPATVIATVDEAFEDNQAPAAPVDVDGSILSLVVCIPSADEIPERMPDLTPSGKPTTKKMTKAIRADTYLTLICGHLLATIKEALAVAPGISHVKAVVVREAASDVYGKTRMEALLAASYARSNLERVQWHDATSPEIVQQAADDLLWDLKGRPPALQPLNLDEEPDLKLFIEGINEKVGA